MSPAVRFQGQRTSLAVRWEDIHNLLALVMLCLFWGVVLYLGLSALV